MDRFWTQHCPPGVPSDVDTDRYGARVDEMPKTDVAKAPRRGGQKMNA